MLLVLMRYSDDLEKISHRENCGVHQSREAVSSKPVTQLEIVMTVPTGLDKPSIFYMYMLSLYD